MGFNIIFLSCKPTTKVKDIFSFRSEMNLKFLNILSSFTQKKAPDKNEVLLVARTVHCCILLSIPWLLDKSGL